MNAKDQASALLERQRDYFNSGATRPIAFRKERLRALRKAILSREGEILAALERDLGKSDFEGYITEIHGVLAEIKHLERNCARWAKTRRAGGGILNFPATAHSIRDPHGVCLIMSPWNYPFMLTLTPLVGAVAAGNAAIVKPSAYSPATSAVIAQVVADAFEDRHVAVVEGGRDVNQGLLGLRFDYIFFTGSVEVGKLVMGSAAKHLTPVTLELGGKSPCVVDRSANIDLAARRAAWGKCLNAGQTCVAPDYFLVHRDIKEEFLATLKKYIVKFYGEAPHENAELPRIVNARHFERLTGLIAASDGSRAKVGSRLVHGGRANPATLRIEPTVFDGVSWDDPLMGEELFGPIIPIIEWDDEREIVGKILGRPRPLAFYLFSSDKAQQRRMLSGIPFGGGCVNDAVVHLAAGALPFGGTGESGMGAYHGKYSFDTFSRVKGVLDKSLHIDIGVRYPPFAGKYRAFRKFL